MNIVDEALEHAKSIIILVKLTLVCSATTGAVLGDIINIFIMGLEVA